MKLATNIKSINELGFQLIIEDSKVLGVNLLYGKDILKKCRFNSPKNISSSEEEARIVKAEIIKIFKS